MYHKQHNHIEILVNKLNINQIAEARPCDMSKLNIDKT